MLSCEFSPKSSHKPYREKIKLRPYALNHNESYFSSNSKPRFMRRLQTPSPLCLKTVSSSLKTPSTNQLKVKFLLQTSPYKIIPTRISLSSSKPASHPKCPSNKSSPLPGLATSNIYESSEVFSNQNRKRNVKNLVSTPYLLIKKYLKNKNYLKALDLSEKLLKNPEDIKAGYYKALCLMKIGYVSQALDEFQWLKRTTKMSANVLLGIYKCFIKLGNRERAQDALDVCLKRFPECKLSLYYKGKAEFACKNYKQAIEELKKSRLGKGFLMISQSWKALNAYELALKYLGKFKNYKPNLELYLFELGKLDYRFAKYLTSLTHLNLAIKINKNNKKILYYISKCKSALEDYEDAELSYEKVANKTHDPVLATRAVLRITRLKTGNHDYYGAFSSLKRIRNKDLTPKKTLFVKYVEAMYSIVQQDYKYAIEMLSEVWDKDSDKDNKARYMVYKAYAYFSLGDYIAAYRTYKEVQDSLDKASEFNYKIAGCMIKYQEKDYIGALKDLDFEFFNKYYNPMWKVLRVFCLIFINKAINDFTLACSELEDIETPSQDYEITILRAVIKYLFFDYYTSIDYIDKYFEISPRPSYLAYIIRAFSYISLSKYTEAYEDLSKALIFNPNLQNLYSYRGVCGFFIGLTDEVIDDFIKFSEIPDRNAYKLAVYLLVMSRNYQKALELLDGVEDFEDDTFVKAHIFVLMEKFDEAVEVLRMSKHKKAKNDIRIIEKVASGEFRNSGDGVIFNRRYAKWINAIGMMYDGCYDKAIEYFQISYEYVSEMNEVSGFPSNPLIQEENCTLLYNLALCYILLKSQVLSK